MESMISQLNQFQSYSLDTEEQLNVVGGARYKDVYQASYQDNSGDLRNGYVARDTKKSEWVFLYWEGEQLKRICIVGIDAD